MQLVFKLPPNQAPVVVVAKNALAHCIGLQTLALKILCKHWVLRGLLLAIMRESTGEAHGFGASETKCMHAETNLPGGRQHLCILMQHALMQPVAPGSRDSSAERCFCDVVAGGGAATPTKHGIWETATPYRSNQ